MLNPRMTSAYHATTNKKPDETRIQRKMNLDLRNQSANEGDLGLLLGGLGVPLGGFWGAFGGHLGAFGWPVSVFWGFVSENVKL